MMRRRFRNGSPAGIFLLAMLLLRAYVPAGFMPASGAPYRLQLCPDAAAGMPAHHLHHHFGTHADFESCPFGGAPAAGPVSHQVDFALAAPNPSDLPLAFHTPRLATRAPNTHPPRGPPSFA